MVPLLAYYREIVPGILLREEIGINLLRGRVPPLPLRLLFHHELPEPADQDIIATAGPKKT